MNSGDAPEFESEIFVSKFEDLYWFFHNIFSQYFWKFSKTFENFEMFDHFLNFLNDYQNILLKICWRNPWKWFFDKEISDFDHFLKNFRLWRWKIQKPPKVLIVTNPKPPNRYVTPHVTKIRCKPHYTGMEIKNLADVQSGIMIDRR